MNSENMRRSRAGLRSPTLTTRRRDRSLDALILRTMLLAPAIVALLVAGATPAEARIQFDEAERSDLIETMQDAADQQRICYGWQLEVDDWSGNEGGRDEQRIVPRTIAAGASQNGDLGAAGCSNTLEFVANVVYTSESSEIEDSASWYVLGAGIDTGLNVSNARLINDPAAETAAAVLQLPLLAVDLHLAQPLRVEANETPLGNDEHLSGDPGSDWVRTNMSILIVLGLGLIGAVGLAISAFVSKRPAGFELTKTFSYERSFGKPLDPTEQPESRDPTEQPESRDSDDAGAAEDNDHTTQSTLSRDPTADERRHDAE